jgi:hypothetical protein
LEKPQILEKAKVVEEVQKKVGQSRISILTDFVGL